VLQSRLLFDCTNVFWSPHVNSGIQRVVRNIVRNLESVSTDAECIPVILHKNRLHRVHQLIPGDKHRTWSSRLYEICQRINARLSGEAPRGSGPLAVVGRVVCLISRIPSYSVMYLLRQSGLDPVSQRTSPIEARAHDELVLLDSTWNDIYFAQVEFLKSKGVRITAVIYDIIPVLRPDFFPDRLKEMYNKWFSWVITQASGFACISQTVASEVEEEVSKRLGADVAEENSYGFFHLGSELDLKGDGQVRQEELQKVFATPDPVILAVGTIEPRKNHCYLLDAFDILRASGSRTRLCIVGGTGWKCSEEVRRIREHPLLGKALFWFNKLGDEGLEFAYRNSALLAISSHAEGFGLPIVESLQRGLPVLASDIPVFREIGSEFVTYFDLNDPASLAQLIRAYEVDGFLPVVKSTNQWRWIDWKDSVRQLVGCVLARQS
jgi:glycosyltransferase involved in cell wall biosynthesis